MENEKLTIKIEDDVLECIFEKGGRTITYREKVVAVYERAKRACRNPERLDRIWIISRYAEEFVRREYGFLTTSV